VPILKCAAWWAQPWVEITFSVGPTVTETYAFGPAPDLLQPLLSPTVWERPPGGCFYLPVGVIGILARMAREGLEAAGYKIVPKTTTPTRRATGSAPVDFSCASQPGCTPVASGPNIVGLKDSGRKKRGQSSPALSGSSNPPDRQKDEPPWQRSNWRIWSAG
jgi:hypothetical protein